MSEKKETTYEEEIRKAETLREVYRPPLFMIWVSIALGMIVGAVPIVFNFVASTLEIWLFYGISWLVTIAVFAYLQFRAWPIKYKK